MWAAFFSKLLLGIATFPSVTVHPWRNRSTAAYVDHVAHFRAANSLQPKSSVSWWNRYRPSFVCPWIDRLGRLSDGGKWVCHWQALLETAAPDGPSCVIYSFGVSTEASFEEALMARLHGRSSCQMWGFDPTVPGFPENSSLTHLKEVSFSATGLRARTRANVTDSPWPSKDLRSIMADLGHLHVDLLKMDIEGSEWAALNDLCESKEPLPFDQLIIELHNINETAMEHLTECLDRHGLYPFSREENLHRLVCDGTKRRGLPQEDEIGEAEYSFVRANSRFAISPWRGVDIRIHDNHLLAGRPAAKANNLTMNDPSLETVHDFKSKAAAITPQEWAQKRMAESRAARNTLVATRGSGWRHLPAFQCRRGAYYLWDLFEPRGFCASKVWIPVTNGRWASFDEDERGSSSDSSDSGDHGARVFCIPELFLPEQEQHRIPSHRSISSNLTCTVAEGPSGAVATGPFAESVARALGCKLFLERRDTVDSSSMPAVTAPSTAASISRLGELADHRVLVARADTAEEWQALKHAACASRPKAQNYSTTREGSMRTPLSLMDFNRTRGWLGNFDQLVLDLALVGSDVYDSSARNRRNHDQEAYEYMLKQEHLRAQSSHTEQHELALMDASQNTTTNMAGATTAVAGVLEFKDRRALSYRRKQKAQKKSRNSFPPPPGWLKMAAANLGPLVECLEDSGFALAHRELLFSEPPEDYTRPRAPAAVHAATCTFVRQ